MEITSPLASAEGRDPKSSDPKQLGGLDKREQQLGGG